MNKKQRKQKHKRQCAQNDSPLQSASTLQDGVEETPEEETLCLWTQTGELFQPVRLYYVLKNRQTVLDAFLHLHCMTFVPEDDRWVWLSRDEAHDLSFSKPAVSSQGIPVVLGAVSLMKNGLMFIDLSSWQRALAAIPFFDAFLPRKAAKLSHLGVVNHLFGERDRQGICFNTYFRTDLSFTDRSLAMIAKLLWITIRTRNMHKRMALLDTLISKEMKTPDPEVEYLKIRYYTEGLQQLHSLLLSRQQVAIQHWRGHTEYTHGDYVNEMIQKIIPEQHPEEYTENR